MIRIVAYKPKKHRRQVLAIFASHPVFSDSEMRMLKEETLQPSAFPYFKWVALENNSVLGFMGFSTFPDTEDSWQVTWLAVHARAKRQGIGSRLFQKLEAKAKSLKVERLFVETCGCPDELQARNFYKKHGFKRVARLPDYYCQGHSKVIYLKLKPGD